MNQPEESSDIELQLARLADQAGDFIEKGCYRTSFRMYGELRQRAKRERILFHYVLGTFHQMDQAQYLFDFQTMRERAVELISLLESEEQCRKIQPDMPLQLYESLAYQFRSCAYENLAEATGQMEGYNSEGLQACITDGIQICRQTGKTSCIGCFREYSCDVYMAADDAEIAQHQCSLVLDDSAPLSSRGDRRWLARKKIAWMTFLEGRTQTAIEMYRDALQLADAEEVSLKLEARLRTLYELEALLILTGQPSEFHLLPGQVVPDSGECLMYDYQQALNQSLAAAVKQEWSAATEPLIEWDRLLQDRSGTHLWFEVRLRLIAIKLLAGDSKLASRLADQLQHRARQANDWLTLRRLTALQDSDRTPGPLAGFGRESTSRSRPSKRSTSTTTSLVTDSAGSDSQAELPAEGGQPEVEAETPYSSLLLEIGAMFEKINPESLHADLDQIRLRLQGIEPASVTHENDACALLHMMGFALGDGRSAAAVWTWSNQLAKNFQENPAVLSMLGDLGNQIRFGPNEEFGQTITAARVEPLFRKAIQLQDAGSGTFMRAGDHFMAEENVGEAERCYARSFRLKRSNGTVAVKLATLYRETDRLRDALHVLDVCLREGADIPLVAWEAGLTAFSLERYEVMLTYLDRYRAEVGEQEWIEYYRATGLLEQGDPLGALQAIASEQVLFGREGFHLSMLRGCALAALGRTQPAVRSMQTALEMPLCDIDYLSPPGIAALLTRGRKAARDLLKLPELVTAIEKRMLQACMAPEEMFDELRRTADVADVHFYQCLLRQPLDDDWQRFPGRWSQDPVTPFYLATWGVLAADESEAQRMVLEWQSQCYPLAAEFLEASPPSELFIDSPGVVWQGQRVVTFNEDAAFDNDSDADDFDDFDEL